jgi:TolB-like protein
MPETALIDPEQIPPTHAVFLSYASQDSQAAARICETLRAAGVEVWFDRSELRGGDAWDSQIKKQIHNCALFLPIISAHTNARTEGYFRREWKLATRRLLDIADDAAFLVPVVIDDTRDADARVPEEFLHVQWTRLREGATPPAFVQRVRDLLGSTLKADAFEANELGRRGAPAVQASRRYSGSRLKRRWLVAALALIALLVVLGGREIWNYRTADGPSTPDSAPPPNSIAVLSFLNLSGEPEDEYFSDGLSEELLNTLVRIDGLQVAARTSAFSFKGTAVDIPTVGRKLNVASVLEGSVRRADERVRITVQLVNTVTGFQLWSQTFDRDLEDVLELQSEIATNVARSLQVVLQAGEAKKLTDGGTTNPAAFDAFLRARKLSKGSTDEASLRAAVALYEEAIQLDPAYALAYGRRAELLSVLANFWTGSRIEEKKEIEGVAKASAEKAVELAPTSGQVHYSLSVALRSSIDDLEARETALKRGLELEPRSYELLSEYARLAAGLGRPDALSTAERAVTLSPLEVGAHWAKGNALFYLRRYEEASESIKQSQRLINSGPDPTLGVIEIAAKRPAAALPHCESQDQVWDNQLCLAIAYYQLGRKPEAATMLQRLMTENGDTLAYQYAEIYAQWGQKERALKWLATAARIRDPGLMDVKADPLIDPIRDDPRFKKLVASLDLPD